MVIKNRDDGTVRRIWGTGSALMVIKGGVMNLYRGRWTSTEVRRR